MAQPSVAVVVVNFNGAAFIDALAASLSALTYTNRRVYLVDNASTDGSAERLTAVFPDADIVINQRNAGLAVAINQALGRCLDAADYVLLLNPDTTQAPDFLDRLVEAVDEQTLVVPKVLSATDGTLQGHAGGFDWTRGLLTDTHDGEPDGPVMSTRRQVTMGSFSCMLIPSAVFKRIGLLDERLGMYYEDTDFVARALEAGCRLLIEPAAVVYHSEGGSSGGAGSPFTQYYATRNRPYVVRKHVSKGRYALFSAYFLTTRALKLLDYTRRRDWRLLRVQLRALRDFMLGRMGMTYTPADFR